MSRTGEPDISLAESADEANEDCEVVLTIDDEDEEDVALPQPAPINPLGTKTKKMDSSQSPTQSNDGRSYEQYFPRASPQSRGALIAEDAEHPTLRTQSTQRDRSLAEDDTGAVVFNIDDQPATHLEHNSLVSELAEASPMVDLGLNSRRRTFALAAAIAQGEDYAPETPVVSHNPFDGYNRAQLVPTSQLFKATQFSSAFRGADSPTSSRPSPADFPHNSISPNPISSPLKARGLRSSPSAVAVTSPWVDDLATPIPHHHEVSKTRPTPDAKGVYVPMRRSQERRSSPLAPSESGSVELSDDDDDDPIERRRRVLSRKKASLERLTSIQFSRTPKAEKIEVPSTNLKKQTKKSRTPTKHRDQHHGSTMSQGDMQIEDMIEDSQNATAKSTKNHMVGVGEDLTQSTQGEPMRPPEGTIMRSSTNDGRPRTSNGRRKIPGLRTKSTDSSLANRETIPETSPVQKQQSQAALDPQETSAVSLPSTLGLVPSSGHAALTVAEPTRDVPASSVTEFMPPVTDSTVTPAASTRPASLEFSSSAAAPEIIEEQPGSSQVLPSIHPDRSPALPSILRDLAAQDTPAHDTLGLQSSPPAPAFSTRSKKRQYDAFLEPRAPTVSPITEPPHTVQRPQGSVSGSPLSSLASTPEVSQTVTAPVTVDSMSTGAEGHDVESPVVAKNKRRRGPDGLPRLLTLSTTESLRSSTRLNRRKQPSDSDDELAGSPGSTPTFEQSLRMPPRKSISRLSRTSTRDLQSARESSTGPQRPAKLFDGMAFAVSFQAKKPGETAEQQEERMEFAKNLQKRIIQAGGKLLTDGFDQLFEVPRPRTASVSPASSASTQPDEEIRLKSSARNIGFTALIADGHSRKVKYMQALALSLPCLAPRWITTCLERDEIVDWTPYLLCAGQSTFLGGAYRSRILTPYAADTARLSEIVKSRAQLLKDDNVLLVMKKSDNVRKGPYVFLARILGASLCQVYSLEEARKKMKQVEALGQPFDWVYVDDKVDKGELFEAEGSTANSKKRKSRGGDQITDDTAANEPPKRIRTLSDELVIQSLILGRLIGDGEMEE